MVEGLYSGLGSGAALSSTQLEVKMKLLVEAPAAVEDALASLLDHHDAMLQVRVMIRLTVCNSLAPDVTVCVTSHSVLGAPDGARLR